MPILRLLRVSTNTESPLNKAEAEIKAMPSGLIMQPEPYCTIAPAADKAFTDKTARSAWLITSTNRWLKTCEKQKKHTNIETAR